MSTHQPSIVDLPEHVDAAEPGDQLVERFHWRIEAGVPETAAALARLDPVRSAVEALTALGVRARQLSRFAGAGATGSCGLVIRVGDGELPSGHIRLVWSVTITPDDGQGCYVSIVQAAGGTDPASARRLRDAWVLLGPLVEHQTRRVLDELAQLVEGEPED
jgi:hypothetical protein